LVIYSPDGNEIFSSDALHTPDQILGAINKAFSLMSQMTRAPKNNLLWWVIPDVFGWMPMPFIHWERRMNHGGILTIAGCNDLCSIKTECA